jgi:hypothetical protein
VLDVPAAERLGACFSETPGAGGREMVPRCLARMGAPAALISRKVDLLTSRGVMP